MITLKSIHKYYNKRKKNEIHVINDTNLTFEGHGLVALLGPSGCGKTTLLNVIGGLDGVDNGSIYINDKKLNRWSDNAIDNIALALKMVGVLDLQEITNRVNYVLKAVGIYRYRNRFTDMLSGGERQRVAIARAIVKDPQIIIADEPTGNLDSKNTLEVMKIIKAISKHKLVILVTHEKDLANFFASRIIEIADGQVISDKENDHFEELDYQIEQKIYLKDSKKQKKIKLENLNINYYSDDSEAMDVTIVVKNNSLYIQGGNQERVESIDNHSMIELIDDHYRKISKDDKSDEFAMDKAKTKDIKLRYHSIFGPIFMFKSGFKKVFDYSVLRKILLVAFAVTAMFSTYAISSLVASLTYDDSYFLKQHKDYLLLRGNLSVEEFLAFESNPEIKDIFVGDSKYSFTFLLDNYYQTNNQYTILNCSLTDVELLEKENIIYGRYPENENELVIDLKAIEQLEQEFYGMMSQAGILIIEDYLGQKVFNNVAGEFVIAGITDQKSPSVYLNKNVFTILMANYDNNYGIYKDGGYSDDSADKINDYLYGKDLKLKKGRWPVNDYEVIVHYDNRYEMKLKKKISTRVNNQKLKVVGYYTSPWDDYGFYVNSNTLKYQMILKSKEFSIIANDKVATLVNLQEQGYSIADTYEESKGTYLDSMKQNINSSLAFNGTLLLISIVEIYLVIRASFLARIKEVGVYRAIGMKKFDIYKMFLGEILIITFLTSFPGVGLMYYILEGTKKLPYIQRLFVINWQIGLIAAGGLLVLNCFFGLLPVFLTIRKKPAAILSRSDV